MICIRDFLKIVVLSLLSLEMVGCAAPNTSVLPSRLNPQERSYLSDVPLPGGFQILEKASDDAMTGKRRLYVRHVYEGRGDAYAVRSFYIEHMPQRRWQKVYERGAKGVHTLRFEKGQESCTITIFRPGANWSSLLHIEVLILQEEAGTEILEPRRST